MAKLWFDKGAGQFCTKLTKNRLSRKFYFGKDKKEAKSKYHQLMADIKSNRVQLFPEQGLALEDLAENYLDYIHTNRAAKTYEQYQLFISKFVKKHRGCLAEDIKPSDLEAFKKDMLKKGKAIATVNHGIKCVKAMYNWAVNYDYLDSHKLSRVKKIPSENNKRRFLSEEEIETLLNATEGVMHDIIITFLDTGMRLSELTSLTWDTVDFEHNQIVLYHHKTSRTARVSKPRVIPMTSRVFDVLDKRRQKEGTVFLNQAGTPYDKDTLRRRFNRVKVKIGLDDVTIHTLRHTFGSRAVMAGIDLKTIAELMGHSSTKTTEIYTHLTRQHLSKAIEKLENHNE